MSRTAKTGKPALRAPMELPDSLSGRAVIWLRGVDEREFKGRAAILVKGPDKVRIEVFDILGQVAAVIVSDGYALSIFSNNDTTFFERGGETPLIFSATELASFLMGAESGGEDSGPAPPDREEGVKEVRRVFFEDFREFEGLRFPFALSVDDGREKLSVRYSSIELNPELNDSLFDHIFQAPPKLPGLH